jgi:hypothetical protein
MKEEIQTGGSKLRSGRNADVGCKDEVRCGIESEKIQQEAWVVELFRATVG